MSGCSCATLVAYKGQELEASTQDFRLAEKTCPGNFGMIGDAGSWRVRSHLPKSETKSHEIFRPAEPAKTAFLQAMMLRLMSWLHRALYVTGFGA